MAKYDVCVVGCGEIGSHVLKSIYWANPRLKSAGMDINPQTRESWNNDEWGTSCGIFVLEEIPQADVYFICVWNTETVINLLDDANFRTAKTIFIETTIDPVQFERLKETVECRHFKQKVVIFPHRFNPGDSEHQIFNLDRLMGAFDILALTDALNWIRKNKIMDEYRIHVVEPQAAVMAKVIENAYRAWEIILAQELKRSCEAAAMDFDAIRCAVNTKWNIDIREARDGVKGKCLPKDLGLFNKMFPCNFASQMLYQLNQNYIKENDKSAGKN